jgi:hypothetical protein
MKTMTIFVVMNEELGRLIQLEGVISSARLMYYYPERVNKDWHEEITISDEQYEEYEKEYLDLCFKLNKPNYYVPKNTGYKNWNTIDHKAVIGVDFNRPSIMKLLNKYSRSKDEFRMFCKNL